MSRQKATNQRKIELTMTAQRRSSRAQDTIENVRNALPKRVWFYIAVICILSSISIQFIAPFIQLLLTNSLICYNPLVNDNIKKIYDCIETSNNINQQKSSIFKKTNSLQKITYFAEPFPVEPWVHSDEDETVETSDLRLSVIPRRPISLIPDPFTEAEAIAALQLAKKSRERGNNRKAEVIIEHAFALAPHHPDVLTEYGIFMETVRNNVIEAEGLYKKALNLNPSHSEALIRRAKTLPLVEEIDNNMFREIRKKREMFLKIPRWNSGLKRAMRESYFQHIYHTVALEGNTFTLGQTRSILESKLAVAGKSIIEHNEILGMDAALRFLNQTLAHVGSIKIEDILAIHKRVLGFVDPIAAGYLRTTQVFVGSFVPTAPEFVRQELDELIEWLNDEETLRIDPVELAAIAHYKLVYTHPFIDGNGRTARLLMNFILMQAGFPPVIIPVEERGKYYLTLKSANDGDLRPFIRFIAKMTDDSLQSFISSASICDPKDCPENGKIGGKDTASKIIETE
jgi:fido (protein-threonine AMPylation protein)